MDEIKEYYEKNKKSKVLDDITLRELCNSDSEYGAKLDANGMPIPGTGKKLLKEEKKEIVNILKESGIPITKGVLKLAIKKYLDGELNITNETSIKL